MRLVAGFAPKRLALSWRVDGLVLRGNFQGVQCASQRKDDEQRRHCAKDRWSCHDQNSCHARQMSKSLVGSTCKLHEECHDAKKIVGRKEKLERCNVKARRRKVEVGVQIQRPASEQDSTDVEKQEQREVGPRNGLQLRDEAAPVFTAPDEKRQTT